MSHSIHATHYAHRACQVRVPIVENVRVARDTFRVRFECPSIARHIVPGQFVMVRLAGTDDPLLGRPLALYDLISDALGEGQAIDVVYLVIGKLTRRLAESRPGQLLDVWGPLGNGFPWQPTDHLVMVGGGIGQTPFLALAKEYLKIQSFGRTVGSSAGLPRVTLCYGVRTADYFSGVDQFAAAGVDVRLSTDDGSCGHHGLVTDLLRNVLDESRAMSLRIVCCGPEPMMCAVSEIAAAAQVPCQVSLETPMACGIGICFACVAKVRVTEGGWDYRRTCVEGPVFDSQCIDWD